jgi:hypothetical protein
VYIYPHEYFCPINYETKQLQVTQNTYSIHHYDASWHSEEDEYALNLKLELEKYFGKNTGYICAFIAAIKFRGMINAFVDLADWIKQKIIKSNKEERN